MNNLELICLTAGILVSMAVWVLPMEVYSQFPSASNTSSRAPTGNATSVSVSATISLPVSNDTLKAKEGLVRGAVINFLNSGPNVLKTNPLDQPAVRSKISNLINNVTQNVEGVEATSAIIGVEISKALKTLISSSKQPGQLELVTIASSSSCKPLNANSVSCENTITIK